MPPYRRLFAVGTRIDTGPLARPIRVVLADDHTMMRRSLRRLLDRERDIDVLAEADSLTTAMRQVQDRQPDVLLLDLRLPDGSSIDTIGPLRAEVPGTEIIVLTMEDSRAFAQQALDAGAIGIVLKDFAEVELIQAVRAAARGERCVSLRITAGLDSPVRHALGRGLLTV